jgi:hypothetical protein
MLGATNVLMGRSRLRYDNILWAWRSNKVSNEWFDRNPDLFSLLLFAVGLCKGVPCFWLSLAKGIAFACLYGNLSWGRKRILERRMET